MSPDLLAGRAPGLISATAMTSTLRSVGLRQVTALELNSVVELEHAAGSGHFVST